MRRLLLVPALVAAGALTAGQLATPTAANVADRAGSAAAHKAVRTQFAVSSLAFGSRVAGGQLPAGSDDTAYQAIGCTNQVGLSRRNYVADQQIPGLGRAEGVTTRVWSQRRGGTVSSFSSHRIARLTLVDSPAGSLEIRGLSSVSQAFNKAGRFGATTDTSIAHIVFKPAGAPAQNLRIPTADRPLVIPGLARIALGTSHRTVNRHGALASADVLEVKVIPLGTRARVGHTQAKILGGIKRGVFQGYSAGIAARGLDDNTKVGRNPLSQMPCQGTNGKLMRKDLAHVSLDDQIVVRGVSSSQSSRQGSVATRGVERGTVARITLGGGRVKINGIVGQVTARRTANGVTSSVKGSGVGSIVVDGEPRTIPQNRPLVIPGLLSLDDVVRTKFKDGARVVGLRIKLLDGTAAVIDLGVAQLRIKPGAPRRR